MKKVLSIVLSIAMVVCLAPTMAFAATTSAQADAAYSDIAGTSCEGAVNVLSALKVVDGFTDGTFKPEQTVTRAQMAKLVVTALGVADYATAKTSKYTDMGNAAWAIPYVEYASNLNIVNGVGNNKFDPDAKITREQLAAVLYRYAGKVGMDVTARADLKLFPDAGSVSAYATDALSWCVANGIVNGTLEHGLSGPAGLRHTRPGRHAHVPLSQAHGSITEKSLRPSNRAASCFFCCNALY